MNVLDGPDVHAPRRLADQQQVRVPLHLARHDDLLLVPPREGFGRQHRVRRAHIKLGHLGGGIGLDRGIVHEQRVDLVFRRVVIAERHVFPCGEIHDQPQRLPVLGHMGNPRLAPRLTIGPRA